MTTQKHQVKFWQRPFLKFAASRAGGWYILHIGTYIDPFVLRWTKGRVSFHSMLGVPIGLVITTGAKSGKQRHIPLVLIEDGDNIALIASKTGAEHNPGWYYNMKANPEVRVIWRGADRVYRAREAHGEERDRLWQKAVALYKGYEDYKQRASHRHIPVMVLQPLDE